MHRVARSNCRAARAGHPASVCREWFRRGSGAYFQCLVSTRWAAFVNARHLLQLLSHLLQAVRDRGAMPAPGRRLLDTRRGLHRSEEHTSELQSLMRISYAVFCLTKKNTKNTRTTEQN